MQKDCNMKASTIGGSRAGRGESTSSEETNAEGGLEVRVTDVCKWFGEIQALDHIDLVVRRGEMVAVIGGSGSGKSVLMRHLTGHFKPDEGRVFIANHAVEGSPLVDLASLSRSEMEALERHWAVVLQLNGLVPGTVYDNIALALRYVAELDEAIVHRRVHEVIEAVGLDVQRHAGLSVYELSGGMAKRVTIARALAIDPLLVFYDEPTSGLDPVLSVQIHELLRTVHNRSTASGMPRTSFIVTHDKDLLRNLRPRIVLLQAGQIVFEGLFEAFERSTNTAVQAYLNPRMSTQR
jgi:phospholipid/cholesterol/gamma-HCH transport system ATP-binding protein